MPHNLTLRNATVVTSPGGAGVGPVKLKVEGTTVTLFAADGSIVQQRAGAQKVSPAKASGKFTTRTVTFGDASAWEVTQPRSAGGCGCGQR